MFALKLNIHLCSCRMNQSYRCMLFSSQRIVRVGELYLNKQLLDGDLSFVGQSVWLPARLLSRTGLQSILQLFFHDIFMPIFTRIYIYICTYLPNWQSDGLSVKRFRISPIWRAIWLTRILIMRGHAYTYFQFTLQLVAVYTPKANHMRSAAFTTRTLNQLTLFLPFRLILSFAFTPYRPLLRLIPLPRIPYAWNCICKSPLHSSVE